VRIIEFEAESDKDTKKKKKKEKMPIEASKIARKEKRKYEMINPLG
jgi:hypothetical protein